MDLRALAGRVLSGLGLAHKRELEYAAGKLTSIEVNGNVLRGAETRDFRALA